VCVLSGEHPGLGGGWKHGIARVSKGQIAFRPYLWQLRLRRPWTEPVDIHVVEVESAADDPKWREAWSVLPGTRRTVVRTPSSTLLWGVPERQADWAVDQVS